MSIADDRLEILMGKLLDGEISPAEQRLLESELEHNSQARELLEQLRTLHECGREVVAGEVLRRGAQQHKKSFWRRVARADGHLHTLFSTLGEPRFAVGLAAGLILGLGLHFVLVRGVEPRPAETMRPVAGDVRVRTDDWNRVRLAASPREGGEITRNVDWYGFTDEAGNRWLVQGVREGAVKPVAYYSDF
jgi:anti-sigma factor RsiW